MLTEANIARIEEICREYPNRKSALVPALYVAQRAYDGWLPKEAMIEVAEVLDLPESHVYAVASFYSMFYLKPVGKSVIQVCTTTPCELRGAKQAVELFKARLGIDVGETTPDKKFSLMEVECLAACDKAPMCQINEDYYEHLDEAKIDEIIGYLERGEKPPYAEFHKWLGTHPIAFTDAELGIDVSKIQRADDIVKVEKPKEEVEVPAAK
ncbi:MAG TPA: NADH-quinone oxidoreductase subunit NuoE [Abditibacteriaceae bacterium]|jgi:NADH-quinone oxidoreductase E subunit|nr:NADH-quinone oxidoreductase subunit NuoE [Abditibacteriaceae bacterium]